MFSLDVKLNNFNGCSVGIKSGEITLSVNASIVTNEHLSWQNATLSGGHVVRSKVIQVKVIKRARQHRV